ncbi:MAG: NAD(P)/FAD-dependent oxidoreductase [Pseudomonadota bacterium]
MSNGRIPLYDCIVLGAGIAGVTAARDLQDHGLKVLLVEGSHRIGGRMYSVRDFVKKDGKKVPIEAGAEYIHVEEKPRYQAFWDELARHGFSVSPLHKCGGILRVPRNRLFFPTWSRTKMLAEVVGVPDLWRVQSCLDRLEKFDPKSQADITAREFAKRCAEKEDLSDRARDLLAYTLTAHTPGGLDALSIAGFSADKIPDQLMEPTEYRLELKGRPFELCGFDALPAKIEQQFRKAGGTTVKSRKNGAGAKVVSVARRSDGKIEVTTENGKSYVGKSAISTFSAGMLDPVDGGGDQIFGTLLTKKKRDALQVVRMGPITKFSLAFKERVWIDDGGNSAGHMSVLSNPRGKARTFFSAFPREHTGPHVLTGLLMNQDHQRISKMTDQEAARHVFAVLGRIYGRGRAWNMKDLVVGKDTPNGFEAHCWRQDWSRDPFAKGGNSFLKFIPKRQRKIAAPKAREALKNPCDTLPLFWAGEATAPAYHKDYQPLAVHGAFMSGRQAAADVVHYLGEAGGDAARFKAYYKARYKG